MIHPFESWMFAISGWLTKHEAIFLYKASRSVDLLRGDVVEIGSYKGKSTVFLALGTDHVTAIDPHKGKISGGNESSSYYRFIMNITRARVASRITVKKMTSERAVRLWRTPIKLLFIDGLHEYEPAKFDYTHWSPFVVSGGIVAMHDAFCGWPGAGLVAKEYMLQSQDFSEIGVVGSIIFGVRGKAIGIRRVIKIFRIGVISLCHTIYDNASLPRWIRYVLVHKILRIFLLNKFSSLI